MNAPTETEITVIFEPFAGKSGSEVARQPEASESSAERRVLVTGDIHGHLDRLEALLRQEDLLGWCELCDGLGELSLGEEPDPVVDCPRCRGYGTVRTRRDEVEVVLLGDLGHFGLSGSPTGDLLTWHFANMWADVILWGNHDRAMVDDGHAFSDFVRNPPEAFHEFGIARAEGRLKLAHAAHGFLMTHAGLHMAFRDQNVPDALKRDPQMFANWINEVEDPRVSGSEDQIAVRDAISSKRGGGSPAGGILWRDINEKLFDGFRQVFGHSADHERHQVQFCWNKMHTRSKESLPRPALDKFSYCVDVGGKGDKPGDNCLAGVYLPDETVVRIDL